MRKIAMAFCLLIVMEGIGPMFSAQSLKVNDIIEKHIAAVGGRAALKKVRSRRFEGTIKTQGLEGKIVSIIKAPEKSYQLVVLGPIKQEVGFDGQVGWRKGRNGLTVLTGDELLRARESAIFNRILRYNDKKIFPEVKLLGEEQIDGKDAYVVEYTLKSGSKLTSYYDAKTFLEIKDVTDVLIQTTKLKREVFSEDFRKVNGLLFPFKLRQLTPVNQVEITIDRYTLNADIDDKIFEVPSQ